MDFRLTEAQEAMRAEARAFADEVIAPGARQRDASKTFPTDCVKAAAAKGYCGLLIAEKYGGTAVGNVGQALILEELARVDASTHVTVSVHNSLVTGPIGKWGAEELKQEFLPRLASGELLGAYALTEPQSGSDAAAMTCTAVKDGDDWVLNGAKMWITSGGVADVIVVFAKTNKDVPNAKGISAFVVDGNDAGVTFGKREDKTGLRASETVQIFFEDVRVPAGHLLGEEDRGFNYALMTLNGGRVGIATQAVGIAQGALDTAIAHFDGKKPPKGSAFSTQDIDFKLSEMATKVEASRLLMWRAAQLRDLDVDHVRESSMAKLFASESCNEVCRDAVALMGPAGQASDAERFLRDARVTTIYEGTTEVQKLVIARMLKG